MSNETITVQSWWLNQLFKDWQNERDQILAMTYAINAMLRQGGDDHCFNEKQLLSILEDILSTTETITLYKNEFFGEAK